MDDKSKIELLLQVKGRCWRLSSRDLSCGSCPLRLNNICVDHYSNGDGLTPSEKYEIAKELLIQYKIKNFLND
jgi:hypothetical protein